MPIFPFVNLDFVLLFLQQPDSVDASSKKSGKQKLGTSGRVAKMQQQTLHALKRQTSDEHQELAAICSLTQQQQLLLQHQNPEKEIISSDPLPSSVAQLVPSENPNEPLTHSRPLSQSQGILVVGEKKSARFYFYYSCLLKRWGWALDGEGYYSYPTRHPHPTNL